MISPENLIDSLKIFENLTAKPESFLSSRDDKLEEIKSLIKNLYDVTKKVEENAGNSSNALPQLIVQDFDEEQIWQEIELQNEDRWNHFLRDVSMSISSKKDFSFPIKTDEVEEESEDEDQLNDSNEESDEEPDLDLKQKEPKKSKKNIASKSIVDDKFFKLHELEAFLEAEDKKEMKKEKMLKKGKLDDSDDDDEDDEEEEIDLFADWESDEGMDDDEANPSDLKYNDFFDNINSDDNEGKEDSKKKNIQSKKRKVESDSDIDMEDGYSSDENADMNLENEDIDLSDKMTKSKKKKVRFDIEQPSSGDDDDENIEGETEYDEQQKEENQSEYEIRQERLKKKIGHLENNLLQEKSWTMKGEVRATNRPQNSLLEEILDFDISSRPAPVITEETTVKLQDIIIQRIKDKSWDDVERKNKPLQDVPEFKKQIVLDQEKSKLSLAQVYEQDYIKQRDALDPDADEKPEEEPKEHKEIKSLMRTLFSKLEALSNFHYTPKVAIPEVKIISNIPAISMEEVAPVATSDATLLAPEEIKAKPRGDIIGKSERTDTDKNRERRQKKLKQREREKEREKREKILDKTNPGLGNKYSREKASRLLQKVTKDRNVEKMENLSDNKAVKSSSAFFTQLQEEVQSTIKSKIKSNKKKGKDKITAKQLKL